MMSCALILGKLSVMETKTYAHACLQQDRLVSKVPLRFLVFRRPSYHDRMITLLVLALTQPDKYWWVSILFILLSISYMALVFFAQGLSAGLRQRILFLPYLSIISE
jgi:hypothetical protein